jgi:hypothetical protein
MDSCKPRAEWCYVCRAKWKTCPCPVADMQNLTQCLQHGASQQQPIPQSPLRSAAAPPVQIQTGSPFQSCQHDDWDKVAGQHKCEKCTNMLTIYVNECKEHLSLLCNWICDSHGDDSDIDISECDHSYERERGIYTCDCCCEQTPRYINRCQDCGSGVCNYCLEGAW